MIPKLQVNEVNRKKGRTKEERVKEMEGVKEGSKGDAR